MTVTVRKHYSIPLEAGSMELGERTLVMGILNVTPDSFSDGGKHHSPHAALQHALDMVVAGADILDIGGESTRPGSEPVPIEVELERVIPVIEAVRESSDVPISIDTTKAQVARAAMEAGADIINDVSALRFDPDMVDVAVESGAPVILMHMRGEPKTMQQDPRYASLFSQMIHFFEERIQFAVEHGVSRNRIIVDPGIGFGKTVDHNLQIIRNLEFFQCLDRPILVGASRKRFIGTLLNLPVEERETGTAVAHGICITSGAHLIRVHDVTMGRQTAAMGDAILLGKAFH